MAKSSPASSRYVLQPEKSDDDIKRLLDEYAEVLEQHAMGAIRDEDIDLSDHPEWTEEMFRNAVRGGAYRPRKTQMSPQLDADVIIWFRQRYPDYQMAMNAALRAYMDAHSEQDAADPDLRKTA